MRGLTRSTKRLSKDVCAKYNMTEGLLSLAVILYSLVDGQ